MTSPMELTLRHLRDSGWIVDICEKWNPFGRVRQDLFGIADVIGVHPGKPGATLWNVMSADHHHMKEHIAKISREPRARAWLESGNEIWLVEWKETRTAPSNARYQIRRRQITLEMLVPVRKQEDPGGR